MPCSYLGEAPQRSPTVRVLAGYAQHTACKLASLGFAARVNFDRLLIKTRYEMAFGQSPFAVVRLGGDPERWVSDRALLVTPKNIGLKPTLSEQRVTRRIERNQKLLENIPDPAEVVDSVASGLSFGPVADIAAQENKRPNGMPAPVAKRP